MSGENPDSFEVNRLVITTQTYNFDSGNQGLPVDNLDPGKNEAASQGPDGSVRAPKVEYPPEIPEVDPDKIEQTRQFADLHNRMQAMMKHISALHRDYTSGRQEETQKLSAIHYMLSKQQYGSGQGSGSSSSSAASDELLKTMDRRLQDMESKVNEMANTITHIKFAVADTGHIEDLKKSLKETHTSLLSAVPRNGGLILTILGSQALLVVAYLIYKRRRANSPKKFL